MIVEMTDFEYELYQSLKEASKYATNFKTAEWLFDKLNKYIEKCNTGLKCNPDTLKYIAILMGSDVSKAKSETFARGFNLAKTKTMIKLLNEKMSKKQQKQMSDLVVSATPWDKDEDLQKIHLGHLGLDFNQMALHIEPFGSKEIIKFQSELKKKEGNE